MDNSSLEFSASNCFLNGYNRIQYQYNTWDLLGGWDNSNKAEFGSRNEDSAHIQQYGKLPWKGRGSFSEARSQAAISSIATAMESWQGMQDNPYEVDITIVDHAYVQVGQKCNFNFAFNVVSDLQTATSYCIVRNDIDFKAKSQKLRLSKNIVRKG